jgi:putative transcriptional regulator
MDTNRRAPPAALLIAAFALAAIGSAWGRVAPAAAERDALRIRAPLRLASAPPAAPSPRPGSIPGREKLAKGRFLIATRQVRGPFFGETVIVLLDHSEEGAAGLIVNRPTRTRLSELLPQPAGLEDRRDRIHLGGPVEPHAMVFLIRSHTTPPDSQRVLADVHVTGSAAALEHVVARNVPASRFHAYLGYAGWAPGQLEAEVARGDWYVSSEKPEIIFDEAPHDLWLRLVREHEGVHVRAAPWRVARIGRLRDGRRGLCSRAEQEARHGAGGRDT